MRNQSSGTFLHSYVWSAKIRGVYTQTKRWSSYTPMRRQDYGSSRRIMKTMKRKKELVDWIFYRNTQTRSRMLFYCYTSPEARRWKREKITGRVLLALALFFYIDYIICLVIMCNWNFSRNFSVLNSIYSFFLMKITMYGQYGRIYEGEQLLKREGKNTCLIFFQTWTWYFWIFFSIIYWALSPAEWKGPWVCPQTGALELGSWQNAPHATPEPSNQQSGKQNIDRARDIFTRHRPLTSNRLSDNV